MNTRWEDDLPYVSTPYSKDDCQYHKAETRPVRLLVLKEMTVVRLKIWNIHSKNIIKVLLVRVVWRHSLNFSVTESFQVFELTRDQSQRVRGKWKWPEPWPIYRKREPNALHNQVAGRLPWRTGPLYSIAGRLYCSGRPSASRFDNFWTFWWISGARELQIWFWKKRDTQEKITDIISQKNFSHEEFGFYGSPEAPFGSPI